MSSTIYKVSVEINCICTNNCYDYANGSFYHMYSVMDLNKVMLIGRSVMDVECKTIESTGTPVANFTLATNRRFKDRDGGLKEEAEYHRIVAYGKSAEVLGNYCSKGKRMYVEGRLRTRRREDSTGQERYSTEIVLDNFIFLDSKPRSQASADTEEPIPTTQSKTTDDVSAAKADATEDIPF